MVQLLTLFHRVWCRWKCSLLFHSTVHSRRVTTAKFACFRRWYETRNRRIKLKTSTQTPWINRSSLEVHLQRGRPSLPQGTSKIPSFLQTGCCFHSCTYRNECRAEHTSFSVCGRLHKRSSEESCNTKANIYEPCSSSLWYPSSEIWPIARKM